MALIKCPECGKQISDKAEVCPHCGIEVQKVLAEIREKQRIQRKKRKKRIIVSIVSAFVIGTIAVFAYLYSIDALNSIPAEYRKQSEDYFDYYEIIIEKGDFNRANGYLKTLKDRTLTNRQAKRLKEEEKEVIEKELSALENTIDTYVTIANDPDTKMDASVIAHIKKEIATLHTYQLDAFQTERLQKAKEKYVEFQLEEMEKRVKLHESDSKGFYSFYTTEQLALDLQDMELSTAQKTRLEELNKDIYRIELNKDIYRIKNQKEKEKHKQLLKTIRDEYVEVINGFLYDSGGGYFLFDITGDEIPELWIKAGEYEAEYQLLVYTYDTGIKLLYSEGAGHTDYYQGDGYVIKLYGHMGYATWEKLTYNGFSIMSTIIYEEDINGTDRDYREPEEKHINLYSLNNKQPILNAFKTD